MGNRSKYVAATATAGALGLVVLRARRHARLEHAAEGIADVIMPSVADDIPSEPEPIADEAHAPGHEHMAPIADAPPPVRRRRERPWMKHHRGLQYRGRG